MTSGTTPYDLPYGTMPTMPKEVSVTLPKYPVIFLTAYLVLASVTVVELSLMPEAENPWPMICLLAAFGGVGDG